MSAFIAKMDKQTYANIKFIKQVLGMSNDEQLLQFMAYSSAAEINAQLKQIEADTQQEELQDEGGAASVTESTDEV